MGRRSPQSAVKRAREQALREKRELKQAKKDARAAERREAAESPDSLVEADSVGAEGVLEHGEFGPAPEH
jgi:hypothetical protein